MNCASRLSLCWGESDPIGLAPLSGTAEVGDAI